MKKNILLELAKDFCLTCPNCGRSMPNYQDFKRKHGCKWCVPEKSTPYGDGHYDS